MLEAYLASLWKPTDERAPMFGHREHFRGENNDRVLRIELPLQIIDD